MAQFLNQLRLRTIINTGVDVNTSDTLLTLSTCTYEFNEACFVVVACRVREGRIPRWMSPRRQSIPSLYPDVGMRLYGGTKPEGAVNMVIGTTEAPPTTTPPQTTLRRSRPIRLNQEEPPQTPPQIHRQRRRSPRLNQRNRLRRLPQIHRQRRRSPRLNQRNRLRRLPRHFARGDGVPCLNQRNRPIISKGSPAYKKRGFLFIFAK